MIVDSACYRQGARHAADLEPHALERLRTSGGTGDFVWVGLHEPDPAEMRRIAEAFSLHPLAVEDSLTAHQRPKVEPYDDMLFVVLKTLWYIDDHDEVETGQVSMFLGADFVVTVRQGAGVELSGVRLDLERRSHLLEHGPSAVVYSVCDRVVDAYEQVARELEVDVDQVETSVFAPERTHNSQRIYVLKREISEVRRAVHPLRAPIQRFGDVIETLDSLLSTAFEAHLARISLQQNEDMRRISAWVAIAAVGTLVAGIYGMNFDHMPELHWRFGYAWALGLMLGASVLLYRTFKRSGWL
jgi:magnesium transporter